MGFGVYLATIVKDSSNTDDRLRVRVIPYMNGIAEDDCPYWSCFFRDEPITGKAGDMVWVIAGDDFDIGYILGYANYCTEDTDDFITHTENGKSINLSIPQTLRDRVKAASVDLMGQELDFINIKVSFWNDSCIHFTDRQSGAYYIAFATGTLYAFQSDSCWISIQGQTKLCLNKDGFSVSGAEAKIQAKDVGLGLNPHAEVLVTKGAGADEAIPSEYVKA